MRHIRYHTFEGIRYYYSTYWCTFEYLQMRRLRMVVASSVEASSGVDASPLAAAAGLSAAAVELGGRPNAALRAASMPAGCSMSRASWGGRQRVEAGGGGEDHASSEGWAEYPEGRTPLSAAHGSSEGSDPALRCSAMVS